MKNYITDDGYVVHLDNSDFDRITRHIWRTLEVDGMLTPAMLIGERRVTMLEFLGAMDVKDGDRFNLVSNNLVLAPKKIPKVPLKGVRAREDGRFEALVMFRGKPNVGEPRDTEREAAADYDQIATSFFGADADTNKGRGGL